KATNETGVQQILINSTTGNDTINYALTNPLTTSEQLKLKLGSGNDTVKLDFSKGVTAPSLGVSINGGGGDENVAVDFGAITNTNLQLSANLGDSWGQFNAAFNGPIGGTAKVGVNVQGGPGYQGVNVKINANIAALAQVAVTENLGSQEATTHLNYSGKLDGKLSVQLNGGTSWNWLESHFNLTPGSTGSLFAHEIGGPSADLLILTINNAGSRLKSLDALINGEGGLNSAESTGNVKVLNAR
ncbi:MAG TPA: hypothetical protein VMS17_09695, partial [Gemmataceae bacterium]|nr:hypothetical protein [Gemmataceae bacterium]